ncbi:restriction endonuclease PLD domain-containing protein [Kordia sp.]|uniref:restriction endonuclease PLD domain-containing protein n=1 Tax=Kordia sp. TaxID=1965332 RepID=UPI003D267385
MRIDNLYENVLIKPARVEESSELYIVSGYASATFLRRHITDLVSHGINFKINLIVGMPSKKSDHEAFLQLYDEYPQIFMGHYYNGSVSVHSKVYSWFTNGKPDLGFAGSANYSQYGFFSNKQINQISDEEPQTIKDFYDSLIPNSQLMTAIEVEESVSEEMPNVEGTIAPGKIQWIVPNKSVRISFLQKDGTLPEKSGLNWGQRKAKSTNPRTGVVKYSSRNPDQAYLSIKKTARKEGFLPERGFTFTMLTDDNVVLDCVVAQGGRKGVQTTNDNSELGRYIRNRLNLANGTFLTADHLIAYGRTDFTLVKINDETFLFDFSVNDLNI